MEGVFYVVVNILPVYADKILDKCMLIRLIKRSQYMRKNLKKQITEIISTMQEAQSVLRQLIFTGDKAALNVLADLQDTAVQIGNAIEESEGVGHKSVRVIEEYCEIIWRIYQCVSQKENVSKELVEAFNQSLSDISTSITDDIKIRKEVVFLPYKASMWDSLESVWQAANDDSDCDAYVIPIPYYDKNPDGSFKEMHYEGDMFPEYVPITHYDSYNMEENHPDMIYIHNPYDENNYVTSVHPFFYSKNLKQYTDELVYIPYFVLAEIDPRDETAVKGMAHFCTVPALIHADKVIVQSENMRQAYIKNMVDFAGEHTRAIWEKKILGLGSPKFDKIKRTKREDLNIPMEWQKIILKDDGSAKKVILYNTSVKALLEYSEVMLQKMQEVFEIFKQNRDEIALLWRPHPLIKATIESMRPQLWEDYCKLVEQYKTEAWGIYDDSTELDRAIALSDAYYGDESSLVQLCKEKGMPVMVQSM